MAPRNVTGAVVRGDDLYGREQEIADLWTRLERDHVLMVAPRRHGKTSLMRALDDRPRPGWDVLYTDVMHIDEPAAFLAFLASDLLEQRPFVQLLRKVKDLPRRLHGWLGDLIQEASAGVPDVAEARVVLRQRLDGQVRWEDVGEDLVRLLERGEGRQLVIVDEFPVMVDEMLRRDADGALRFLRWFQRVRRLAERSRFLLGGSLNIGPILERAGQDALLSDLARFPLRPFPLDVRHRFVRDLLRGEDPCAGDEVAASIVHVTGSGVPYYLQEVVQAVLQEARVRRVPVAELDVGEVYATYVVGPANRTRFSHHHTRLRQYAAPLDVGARRVLHALCRVEELSLGAAALHAGDDVPCDDLLARLEADFYVLRDGDRVRFADAFLKTWWQRNAPAPGRA